MVKRDFRKVTDLTAGEVHSLFQSAIAIKKEVKQRVFQPRLAGRQLAMLFEKPSLRTRCTFELAMRQAGGDGLYLGPSEIGIGKRESVHDIAKNLERWFDLVMIRTFAQSNVDGLAQHCSIPVVNALSDDEHPCQAMADLMTVLEKRGSLEGFKLAFVGDGNNICHSLMFLSALLGLEMRVASPQPYLPPRADEARALAEKSGAKIVVTTSAAEAVEGADAVYTDVWASMGREDEAEERRVHFRPYQVNAELMRGAKPGALIMHDLPAHRGEEITDEMIDSPRSVVFDQAENRLHIQKAILIFLDERR